MKKIIDMINTFLGFIKRMMYSILGLRADITTNSKNSGTGQQKNY